MQIDNFVISVDTRSGNIGDYARVDFTNTRIKKDCPPTPTCDRNQKYRTIDGSCNNLLKPRFGQGSTPLQRILPNAYADGEQSTVKNFFFIHENLLGIIHK